MGSGGRPGRARSDPRGLRRGTSFWLTHETRSKVCGGAEQRNLLLVSRPRGTVFILYLLTHRHFCRSGFSHTSPLPSPRYLPTSGIKSTKTASAMLLESGQFHTLPGFLTGVELGNQAFCMDGPPIGCHISISGLYGLYYSGLSCLGISSLLYSAPWIGC